MRDYSPKRRTALVLAGTGTSGAYHAGALRALDESGIKIDVVVGSGVGTLAAAFAAVAGGEGLHGRGGFWQDLDWATLYRPKPFLRLSALLLAMSFGVFLLPVALALLAGLLVPLSLVVDIAWPGVTTRLLALLTTLPALLRTPYLAALAVPVFVLSLAGVCLLATTWLRRRRRFAESFESPLEARGAERRLARGLWQVARGSTLSELPPSSAELGRRYVALAQENLGQPGFRELVLRAADLELGVALPFVLLEEGHASRFATNLGLGLRVRAEAGLPSVVDLRAPGLDALFFDAVLSGLLPPVATPLVRVKFPKGGLYSGETHRLADATIAGGCGIAEALAAGADQIVLVTAVPVQATPTPRRRGPWAAADGLLSTLERQAVERELQEADRVNRMVETLGHRTDSGRAWQDPANGRVYRDFGLYVIRPERRSLGPLEHDGARDPASDAMETSEDLAARGYRDAYHMFVEPVVGAGPEPRRSPRGEALEAGQAVEL